MTLIRQVAAPYNCAGGCGMTCYWIRPNVRHRAYWNSTSGFDFDHITAVDMSFCTKLLSFGENRVFCILATDRRTDDSIDALSRSRCRERQLNKADRIITPCNVARSWHWFRQETADCNLQCGMWLWNHDSEFTKWQLPAMWYVALGWHATEFDRRQHTTMWHVAVGSSHWIRH